MFIYLQMLDSPADQSKFEQLYDAYCGLLYHIAYQILGNQQDAEDAVHSAFVKAAEHIDKFSEPVCPKSRSLIVIIVKNKSIDLLRHRKRHETLTLNEDLVLSPQRAETNDQLAQCILKLPERYQEVILLKYRHGYSLREISSIMDISPSAATKLEQRAKKKLEKMCTEEGLL